MRLNSSKLMRPSWLVFAWAMMLLIMFWICSSLRVLMVSFRRGQVRMLPQSGLAVNAAGLDSTANMATSGTQEMRASTRFKQRLASPGIVVAPGCYDGLSARLVAEAGFEAAYASGGAIARISMELCSGERPPKRQPGSSANQECAIGMTAGRRGRSRPIRTVTHAADASNGSTRVGREQ